MLALDGIVSHHLKDPKLTHIIVGELINLVPTLVFCFGLVSLCTAFVKSYTSMLAIRALLGIFEGGAMPGTAFFLSCFYKKTELVFRMSIFIASSSLASSFGGLLAAALSYVCQPSSVNRVVL